MNVSLDISCNDSYSIVTEILDLLKESKVEIFGLKIDSTLFGKGGVFCTKNSKPVSAPTESDAWNLVELLPKVCGSDDKACTNFVNEVVKGTKNFLDPDHCGPTFCGDDSIKDYKVLLGTCDNVKNAIKYLLTTIQSAISKYKNKLPKEDQQLATDILPYLELDKLCSVANVLTPQEGSSLIASKLPELLAKILNVKSDSKLISSIRDLLTKLNMASLLKCLCPNMGQKDQPLVPVVNPPPPQYNKKLVGILALIIFIVTLIPVILLGIFVKTKKNKIISMIVTTVLGIALFLALFFSNPICILKPCPEETDPWSPISGTFEGSSDTIAGVQISAKIDASNTTEKGQPSWMTQKIRILSLKCTDSNTGACPINNLLTKCDHDNLDIKLGPEENYGYPLSGDCINEMYKIKGVTGKQTVRGVWALRKDSKLYMQILAEVVIPPVDLTKYILVELKPVS